MWILLLVCLLAVPFFAGYVVRKVLEPSGRGIVDTYLFGVLTLLAASGALQLPLLLMQKSFSLYEKIYAILILILSVTGLVLFTLSMWSTWCGKQERNPLEQVKMFWRSWFRNKVSFVFCILTVVVFGLCMLRVFIELPDVSGDFTLETILTTLSTDTIYQYNSFTGQVIGEGMPIRQQILTLPFFLAFLSDVFKVDVGLLVYKGFPCMVLFWTALVYVRWGSLLFSKQREKESAFLFVVSIMLLAGDYAKLATASLLLHQGFTGYALCAGFVIPYALYLCLKGKWLPAFLCVGAELFLIWTTYGLGYSALVIAVCALLKLGQLFLKKRKK